MSPSLSYPIVSARSFPLGPNPPVLSPPPCPLLLGPPPLALAAFLSLVRLLFAVGVVLRFGGAGGKERGEVQVREIGAGGENA